MAKKEKDRPIGISDQYRGMGVEEFYRTHGGDYENPHFAHIQELLIANENRLDYSNVLDLCCGAGEVTRVLSELGYPNTMGCDPYTQAAYHEHTGKTCLNHDFDHIIRRGIEGTYSCVICSFALHLCPEKRLFPLVRNLFLAAPTLVVITPHKRPDLTALTGTPLLFEDAVFTKRGKKVRLRAYGKQDE